MLSVVCANTVCSPPSRYTGKERDTESGLDNFGARYDSSSLGRFMTPDWSAAAMKTRYFCHCSMVRRRTGRREETVSST